MALKPPGSRSNLALLVSALWTSVMLVLVVGGNGVLVVIVLGWFGIGGGLEMLAEQTMWPHWTLVALAVLGVIVDGWIFWHHRMQRKRALER